MQHILNWTLFSAVAFGLTAGCSGSTGTSDGGSSNPTITALCSRLVDFERRCGVPDCQVNDFARECPTTYGHLRAEALSAVDTCSQNTSGMMCPPDGGGSSGSTPASMCFANATASLAPTQAQRDAASRICNACPAAGGSSASTPAQCLANFFTVGDGGSSGLGGLVLILDDATAGQVAVCAAAASTDAGVGCGFGLALCAVAVLGGTFNSSCNADGGVTD
jgi:hypothetical protein